MSHILSRLNRAYATTRSRILQPHNDTKGYADYKQLKKTAVKAAKSVTKSVQSLTQKVTSSGKGSVNFTKVKESAATAVVTVSKSVQSFTQKVTSSGRLPVDLNKIKDSAMTAAATVSKSLQTIGETVGNPKGKIESITSTLHKDDKASHQEAAAALASAADEQKTNTKRQVKQIVPSDKISFEDPKSAYAAKTNWELIRALLVYNICSIEYMVANNKRLMHLTQKILGTRIFTFLMKLTFYGHFVAGEDEYKIQPVLRRLDAFGVKAMLDYAVEDDLPSSKAKELEKKAVTSKNDTIKHSKEFQFSEKFADRRYKVDTARIYFYINEATCERNMEYFLRCMEALSASGTNNKGVTAIKVTALGRPQLLLQLSEAIVRCRRFINELMGGSGSVISHHIKKHDLAQKISTSKIQDKEALQMFLDELEVDSEGIIHIFPWSGIASDQHGINETFRIPDVKTGKMVPLCSTLSKTEEAMFKNMIRRFDTIMKAAQVMDTRVAVDAEQTYFQPAISRVTVEFMRKYNKERHVVLNTYQTYLKASMNEIVGDLEQARRQQFRFGCKLVRGAYLEQERERAATLNYPDPTNPDYDSTTKMFHGAIDHIMRAYQSYKKEGKEGQVYLCIASHNEDSVRFGLNKMVELGIGPQEGVVSFAQLFGMCDYLTFPLGAAGYSCYKYIPYGPVMYVLPYLSRRAQENRGVMAKVQKEKAMLFKELSRRIKSGKLMYRPRVK